MGEKVLEIVADQAGLHVDDLQKELERNLTELGLDSLDMTEIVTRIEDEAGVVIPDTEWGKIKTLNDLIKFVEENE